MSYSEDDDVAIDVWHDGYFSFRSGATAPSDPALAVIFADGQRERAADVAAPRVVSPARPEGYYHSPIGTFD